MNRTIEGSEAYIVCMSTKRGEKDLEVIANGKKEANFLDLEINLEDAVLKENNTIVTNNGVIKCMQDAYKTLMANKANRKTQKALNKNIDIEK